MRSLAGKFWRNPLRPWPAGVKVFRIFYTVGEGSFYLSETITAFDCYHACRRFDQNTPSQYRRKGCEEIS